MPFLLDMGKPQDSKVTLREKNESRAGVLLQKANEGSFPAPNMVLGALWGGGGGEIPKHRTTGIHEYHWV